MLLAFHKPIYGYCSHIDTSQWFVNDFDDLFAEWLTDESVSNLISRQDHYRRFPSSRTSGKTQKGFGPAQKLILDPFE